MPTLPSRQRAFYRDFYVTLRGERIWEGSDAMIFAFYSVVIERTANLIAEGSKSDSSNELGRAFSLAQNKNSGASIRRKRLVADRKSGVAIFSA